MPATTLVYVMLATKHVYVMPATTLVYVMPATTFVYVMPATTLLYVIPATTLVYEIPATTLLYVMPATTLLYVMPATTLVYVMPAITLVYVMPATTLVYVMPATTFVYVMPATTLLYVMPATTLVYVMPATTLVYEIPATTLVYVMPATTLVYVMPATTLLYVMPATTLVYEIPATTLLYVMPAITLVYALRKAFTQYKNKNSFKKQFKAGVPQGGVLSPTLFNIYMSDLPTPPRDIHVTTYADDITIYSSDKNYTIAQQRLQPYLEDVQTWTKANDLKLNASKTMTTLFTPDPAEYRDELSLQLDNTRLPTIRNPKILGLTFDPKLTFNEHIKTSKDKAEKTINILKALTSTHWGKNKETLTNTYKTVTRPILEYAGTIYAPIISDKQLTALQVTQNQGLRIATGCTSDTNINHIHDETKILPIEKHLRLHSSQLRQKASHPDHPLHRLTTQPQPPRLKKKTIFNNNQYTLNIDPDPTHAIDENTIKRNMKTIHTTIVQDHLSNRPINKLLNRPPPDIDKKEETLPHSTRRKLSQLRTNKSPLLMTYLHKIDPANHPAANCPLCNDPNHDSLHLFNCPDIPTTLTVWDLWTNPVGVAALLDVWGEKLGGPRAGV